MKKMGREMGEDVSDAEIDEMVDEAMTGKGDGREGTESGGSHTSPED
jgi:hypothetical protein